MPRPQRAHVRLQPAAGDPLFQPGQVFRRRVRADERLVFGAGQQAGGLVARRLDLLQRVVEAPRRPRPIEAPDRPTDAGVERSRRRTSQRRCRAAEDRVLSRPVIDESSVAVHANGDDGANGITTEKRSNGDERRRAVRRASRSDAARSDRSRKRTPPEFMVLVFTIRSDRASRPASQADPSNRCLLRSTSVAPFLCGDPVRSVLSVGSSNTLGGREGSYRSFALCTGAKRRRLHADIPPQEAP